MISTRRIERRRRVVETDKLNPWRRKKEIHRGLLYTGRRVIHPSKSHFNSYDVNKFMDAYNKISVLKVSQSVVALVSYSAGEEVFWASGVIFTSFSDNNTLSFTYYVLTSATLLKPPPFLKTFEGQPPRHYSCPPIEENIRVYLNGGNLCQGTVVTYDPHYNIAVLSFKYDTRLPCSVLRPLDDSHLPTKLKHTSLYLRQGDPVIDLARSAGQNFHIMAAPGRYNAADCFDDDDKSKRNCMELFRSNCKITKCGIGGPLISCAGEVIGIYFYAENCTPFLPINVFLKWWSHYQVARSHCRPSLGMKVANLNTADRGTLDQVQKLGISQGVIIKKVLSGSPAKKCGLRQGDIVFKCSDTIVVSSLKFFEITWDMARKVVEVVVVRKGSYKNMKIEVKDVTSASEFYQECFWDDLTK